MEWKENIELFEGAYNSLKNSKNELPRKYWGGPGCDNTFIIERMNLNVAVFENANRFVKETEHNFNDLQVLRGCNGVEGKNHFTFTALQQICDICPMSYA